MIKKYVWGMVITSFFVCAFAIAQADDTCVFTMGDSVDPNIVVLLDNGAEMEQISWADGYDPTVDYTSSAAAGTFTATDDYVVYKKNTNDYLIFKIDPDLSFSSNDTNSAVASSTTNSFTFGDKTVALPYAPSTVLVDGVIDNAAQFRYSGNYLRWLFSDGYRGDGSDLLPAKSRFYYAKKAIFTMAEQASRDAIIGIHAFTSNALGASNVQPLGYVTDDSGVLDSSFVNTINTLGTVDASPLSEGLASIGGYFDSPSSGVVGAYCQRNFVLVVSAGKSSEDQTPAAGSFPSTFLDYDGDNVSSSESSSLILDGGTPLVIPTNLNGSTWMDDVAYFMATHDMVGYRPGDQNLNTYTVGVMCEAGSTAYLINTSNNGNGNFNLYDTSHPDYGKYHFVAETPEGIATSILEALNAILENTNTYTAPVVPITRTTSGNRIYLSFFTPSSESTFWEGNVVKYGLDESLNIVGADMVTLATEANGALKPDADPFWQTKDWASTDTSTVNSFLNAGGRNIYTYLGTQTDLTHDVNLFSTTNFDDDDDSNGVDDGGISAATLGVDDADFISAVEADIYAKQIINFVNGLDPFDEDDDENLAEYRSLVTGSVLHSEPLVYEYIHSSGSFDVSSVSGSFAAGELLIGSSGGSSTCVSAGSTLSYKELTAPFSEGETITGKDSGATAVVDASPYPTYVFYGADDGMLHAVSDTDGREAWGFIFPDQLPRLKLMLESLSHEYYVDSSPKIYLYDKNDNGFIDIVLGDAANSDQVILVCGERKGGSSYIAVDVTDPEAPKFLWRKDSSDYPELGESWSEPRFGKVKIAADDKVGIPVVIFGGGYGGPSGGNAVFVLDVRDGTAVRIFKNGVGNISGMNYSIPSSVRVLDTDKNGFADKLYVGDIGGQLWRIGRFDQDESGGSIFFPQANENIDEWRGQMLFSAGCNETSCIDSVDNNGDGIIDERRSFFYPPTITLDALADYVFISSGDRENPCNWDTQDEVYLIKDNHSLLPDNDPQPAAWTPNDLSDVTDGSLPDDNDHGWYISLAAGEKVLSEGVVFGGVFFFTTYTPIIDPCLPGGLATVYGVDYKSAQAVIDMDSNSSGLERSLIVGGGIPSKPVIVIRGGEAKMLISVGSTNPDDGAGNFGAGIFTPDILPEFPSFILQWWKEVN